MKSQKNRSKALQELDSREADALNEQLEKYLDIDVFSSSEAGKILIKSLKSDIIFALTRVLNKYEDTPASELVPYIATLKARIDLLRTLTRAKTNKEILEKELDEMIGDTLDE